MSMVSSKVETTRKHIESSYVALQGLLNGPIASLHTDKLYQTPVEDEWTIMEILAHLVEIMSYWASEVTKLVAQPDQHFGRTLQQEERLAAVRDHRQDSLEQMSANLSGSYKHLDEVLSHLQESDLELTGHHVFFGERTLAWFIEELIAQHLYNHVVQLEECLQAVQ